MSILLAKILRQAFTTFDKSNVTALHSNIKVLCQLTDQLTYRDIKLHPDIFSDKPTDNTADAAPCTYIHVFENADISISVFVLRGNFTMPLHDHPLMHGILKAIHGKLHIKSYTKKHRPEDGTRLIYDPNETEFEVTVDEPKEILPRSRCITLTPHERNFHEITAVDGVAAFFDILSPPYEADIPIYGKRQCNFYQAIRQDDGRTILQRICYPGVYYCDTVEAPEAAALGCTAHLETYGKE